jgi:hypothetical protein
MWSDSLAWRAQFSVDTILDDFAFHEREQFLTAYVSLAGGGAVVHAETFGGGVGWGGV